MWSRAELKQRAKDVFASCRWSAIGVSIIYAIASGGGGGGGGSTGSSSGSSSYGGGSGLSSIDIAVIIALLAVVMVAMVIGVIVTTFVSNPIEIGTRRFFMVARQRQADFREITFSFSNGYIKNVVIMFLKNLYTFLWSCLFIVPGIIKSYEYRMIPYILAENPDIDRKDAFELSKRMMDGQKWDTFVLDLSFFPWVLLTLITCGMVGIFYYLPYYNCTAAELYATLRNDLIANDPKAAVLLPGFEE